MEDPPTSRFTWRIENFSRLKTKKHYSDAFTVGGYKWRILIFPKGNNVDHLSMYLDVADAPSLPYGWTRKAQFSLAVIDQIHKDSVRKDTQYQFNARESDWGFTTFMALGELYDPARGYLVNDTVVVEAEVAVDRVVEYTVIKVARDVDLAEQIGKDIYFDLVDHDKVKCFRIQKQMSFNLFKEEVAKEFGVPVRFQRFWLWAKRQNHTYRPNRPLTPLEEARSVGQLREVSNKVHNAELKLFLEVDLVLDLRPVPPPDETKEDILLFFKHYDPENEELRYAGRLMVKRTGKPTDILTKLNEMVGYAPDEEIEVYEEIKFRPNVMCEPVDRNITFGASQLEDGDIICFQRAVWGEHAVRQRYPDVSSFLDYVLYRQERLKREQEEKEHKNKEKAEDHLYAVIKVARDEDLAEQIGKDIYFDLVDHDKVKCFRIQKQMPFNLFKEEVAKEFGVPVRFQRFWLWAKRQNHTYRPDRPLTPLEEARSVGRLREVSNKVHNAELKLFLEVDLVLDLRPIPPPVETKEDILLFFKHYDPENEELRYVGRLMVKRTGKLTDISTKLNEMVGYAPDEEIEVYEEIRFRPNVMCEPVDRSITFGASQLKDGDIVCFQRAVLGEDAVRQRYPDVPSFLDYMRNRLLPQTNPGLNNTPFKFTKYSNAYMLVYIRESDKEKIICDVDEKDIAEHLRVRCSARHNPIKAAGSRIITVVMWELRS
ncbi:hypothetical protein Dimus_011292 [Dionaea muscipula]